MRIAMGDAARSLWWKARSGRSVAANAASVSSTSVSAHGHLLGIQAGRGVAALLVVFFHAGRMLSLPQYVGHVPWGNGFRFGHAGVDFFFVLSGFIITYVLRHDVGNLARLPRYAWRRLTRIYPIYWVVTAAVIVLTLFSRDAAERLQTWQIVASFLLLPHAQEPLVGVAWTLEHEMLFYLAFALAIIWRPLGILMIYVCVLTTIAGRLGFLSGDLLGFFDSPYHLEFLMGIASALIVVRYRCPMPRVLMITGAIAFIAIGVAEDTNLLEVAGLFSILLFGAACAAILIGAATAERAGALRIGRGGALLGAASYSVYLTHTLVIGLTAHLMAWCGIIAFLPDWSMLLIVVCAAGTAGLLLYWFVERPLNAGLRRIVSG